MNRRGFLKLFSAGAATAIARPTYFFAPRGGWNSGYITYLVGKDALIHAKDIHSWAQSLNPWRLTAQSIILANDSGLGIRLPMPLDLKQFASNLQKQYGTRIRISPFSGQRGVL